MKQILPKVQFSFWDFIRLFSTNTFSDIFHALQKGVLFKEVKSIFVFRFMQFYGTYLGHRQKGQVTKELKNRFYYPNGLSKSNLTDAELPLKENQKKIEYN